MDVALYKSVILKKVDQLPTFFQNNKESVSFFFAYLGQIIIQHYLHSVLVFGRDTINTREKYFKSLKVTYATLFGMLVGSTICNNILLKLGVSKDVAFWTTLYGFGLVSFAILSLAASMSKKKDQVGVATKVKKGGAGLWVTNHDSNSCTDKNILLSTEIDRRNWVYLLEGNDNKIPSQNNSPWLKGYGNAMQNLGVSKSISSTL